MPIFTVKLKLKSGPVLLCALLCCCFFTKPANARVIHVGKSGNDQNTGNIQAPLLTIGRAEQLARPGDQIMVHQGIYREMISFNLGGTSAQNRITYIVAPGELVKVKGSERIKNWTPKGKGVWFTEVDDKLFNGSNPFEQFIAKDSSFRHLGAVYLDDKPLAELGDSSLITGKRYCWFTTHRGSKTILKANFGKDDPNLKLTEINVRPAVFIAKGKSVNYITLDGFQISQIATPPAFINGEQPGAIYTNGGTHWLIQNCTISDSKSVAIAIGETGHAYPNASPRMPEYSDLSQDIAGVGHHVIRHNHIFRCGQAGIFGLLHGTLSEIKDNLIEDINNEGDYPVAGSAAIRLAVAVDALIEHNLIRGRNSNSGSYGVFLGPLFQGTRVSRNIIISTNKSCLYFFNSHGPALVDNNVFSGPGKNTGEGIKMHSAEANVFVQNLFYDCSFQNSKIPGRSFATSNFLAHTLVIKQTIPALPIDSRWWGNLFIKGGLDELNGNTNCESDYNAFVKGALGAAWGDRHSKFLDSGPTFKLSNGVKNIKMTLDNNLLPVVACPLLGPDFIGFFTLSKQYLEYPDGRPITIDSDFYGIPAKRFRKATGPFYKQFKPAVSQELFTY